MAEDLNTDQSVTDQSLEAGAANQQDLNNADSVDQQTQDAVLADGDSKADKTVKYSEFEKANEAKKAAEEQAAHAQRQLELMAQNQAVAAQPQQAALTNEDQALQDLGLEAGDLYGENIVAYTKRLNQLNYASYQQTQALSATQQFMQSHPDVGTVVGSVNPATGQLLTASQELMDIIAKKPYLQGACQTLDGAYNVVMNERQLAKVDTRTPEEKQKAVDQQVANNTAPMGGSAAGGGGGGGTQQGVGLLSREQVAAIDAKLAAGEYR